MKKIFTILALAALTIGLLGSCSKINERIDDLEKKVDGIGSTSVASVQQQIDGIKASITKLEAADETINGKIGELKTAAEAQQTLIDALKEASDALEEKDEELEERISALENQPVPISDQIKALEEADKAINVRIDNLKTYVDTEIGKTKDWATATFATLDQYQQTADDLAALSVAVTGIGTTLAGIQTSISGLDTRIDGIDTSLQGKIADAKAELESKIASLKTELEGKIATAITASETSVKAWVNTLLEGYYTAAQVDAKISALNTAIEAAKVTANERIDSAASELTALKTAVDTAKVAIRTEYRAAIATAISDYDGEIRGALLDSIAAVNGRIAALDARVSSLESRVLAVEGNVDKLLAMIQSVSITPAYSDGSVEAMCGILTLKCIVSPAEALTGVTTLKDSLIIYADSVKVKTRSTSAYMEIEVSEATVTDAQQGAITLNADISEFLPKGADKALAVALNVKNGISNFTTEFVPVYVTLPAGALSGVFSISETRKVHFSQGNLVATINASGTPTAWKFAANQYDYLGAGGANKTIGVTEGDVDLFFWSTDAASNNWGIHTKSSATDGFTTGNFKDWGKAYCASNSIPEGIWRTLSQNEWTYLFNTRTASTVSGTADARYAKATVNSKAGVILLPDTYAHPEGVSDLTNINTASAAFTANNYDLTNWAKIESAGAVFLPAAGVREDPGVYAVGTGGYYWSSSVKNENEAYYLWFCNDFVEPDKKDYRWKGFSVRLITKPN